MRIFDAEYWELKYKRIHAGLEHPKIEQLLLAYAFGEPPKEIHQSGAIIHLGPLHALALSDEAPPERCAAPRTLETSCAVLDLPEFKNGRTLDTEALEAREAELASVGNGESS